MVLTDKQSAFIDEYSLESDVIKASLRAEYTLKPWSNKIKDYYVYFLIDPQNQSIFYVGKGKGKRCFAHSKEWANDKVVNIKKHQRIDDIACTGRKPIVRIFADNLSEGNAYDLERRIIEIIGIDSLTNMVPGQMSERKKNMLLARLKLKHIKPFDQWVSEKPRTEFQIDMYWRILEEYKKIAKEGWESEIKIPNCRVYIGDKLLWEP